MMTKRRTGWRRLAAVLAVAGALAVPAVSVHGQAATPTRTAAQATQTAVTAAMRSGEPVQDATVAALVLGALVVGGLTLKRFAERRA